VARERREAPVELAREITNLLCVLRQRHLPPAVGDGLQQSDQARGCREYHVLVERLVKQARIAGQRCAQELVAGNEQDDKFRAALELRPVGLRGQLAHTLPDLARMPLQGRFTRRIVGRLHRGEVRIQRRLDVDDQLPALGQVHDHVGAQRAIRRRGMRLLGEVAVLHHAGEFDEAPQRHFAPLAAHLRAAQGGDEVTGLGAECLLTEADGLQQAADAAECLVTFLLDLGDLALGALQGFADRRHQRFDRLFPGLKVALGLAAMDVEVLPRKLEEVEAVVLQRAAREVVEDARKPLFGQRERAVALLVRQGTCCKAALGDGELLPETGGARL
jgi:hypothetical protein